MSKSSNLFKRSNLQKDKTVHKMVGSTHRHALQKGKCNAEVDAPLTEDKMLGSNKFDECIQYVLGKIPEEKKDWFEHINSLWFYLFTSGHKDRVLAWCKKVEIFCKKYTFRPIIMWSQWRLVILSHFDEDLTTKSQSIVVLDSLKSMEQRIEMEIRKALSWLL